MSGTSDWSPDEALGTETFDQDDEAASEEARLDPAFGEEVDEDPSRDPAVLLDQKEVEEAGAELDDPEAMVTIQGGGDDPDGLGGPPDGDRAGSRVEDEEGWDLDAMERSTGEDSGTE